MEEQLAQFLRPGTFVVVMMANIITFFIARIVHVALPWWKAKKQIGVEGKEVVKVKRYKTKLAEWWNEVLLPMVPVLVGAGIGLVRSEFLWGPANSEPSVCMMIGAGLGWLAERLYKVLLKLISKNTGVDITSASRE